MSDVEGVSALDDYVRTHSPVYNNDGINEESSVRASFFRLLSLVEGGNVTGLYPYIAT